MTAARRRQLLERLGATPPATPSGARPAEPPQEGIALPASSVQRGLWFIDQWDRDQLTYNVPLLVELRGPLVVDALERAVGQVVARHEVLRSTFTDVDGEPWLQIAAPGPVPLPTTDLGGLPEAELVEQTAEIVRTEIRTGFDLAVGPLVRARLVRWTGVCHLLLINIHHIVIDGWSTEVLLADLRACYLRATGELDADLPTSPYQHREFVAEERRRLDGGQLDAEVERCRQALTDLRGHSLPVDGSTPRSAHAAGRHLRFTLPDAAVAAVRDRCRWIRCTPFAVLAGVFGVLLAHYGRSDDIAVGSPFANREDPRTQHAVGYFCNMVVIRLRLAGDPTLGEALERSWAAVLDAAGRQQVPFEEVVRALRRAGGETIEETVRAVFAMYDHQPRDSWGPVQSRVHPLTTPTAKFDLSMMVSDQGHTIAGSLTYRVSSMAETDAARMVADYLALLHMASVAPDTHLTSIRLPSDGTGWSGPRPSGSEQRCHCLTCEPRELLTVLAGNHALDHP